MTIPLVWFLEWRLPRHLTQPVLQGHVVIEPDECRLAADCAQFRTWTEDIGTHSAERYRISLLAIEARLRRLAWTVAPDQPRKQAAAVLGQGRLSRVERTT